MDLRVQSFRELVGSVMKTISCRPSPSPHPCPPVLGQSGRYASSSKLFEALPHDFRPPWVCLRASGLDLCNWHWPAERLQTPLFIVLGFSNGLGFFNPNFTVMLTKAILWKLDAAHKLVVFLQQCPALPLDLGQTIQFLNHWFSFPQKRLSFVLASSIAAPGTLNPFLFPTNQLIFYNKKTVDINWIWMLCT